MKYVLYKLNKIFVKAGRVAAEVFQVETETNFPKILTDI